MFWFGKMKNVIYLYCNSIVFNAKVFSIVEQISQRINMNYLLVIAQQCGDIVLIVLQFIFTNRKEYKR